MFSFKVYPYRKKDGNMTNVIFVTGDKTDSTYPFKEQMKQFGAKWINSYKTWGWYGSEDPKKMRMIIDSMVKPAVEFLLSQEKNQGDDGNQRTVISILDELLKELNNDNTQEEIQSMNNVFMSKQEIQRKIQEFKEALVSTVNGDDFKRLIMPIINARRAQGYKYSFKNTILIWVQDPKATLVKSKGKWANFNRVPKADAPRIGMFVPVGGDKEFKGKEAREKAKARWMQSRGFASEDDMTLGEKEQLKGYLDSVVGEIGFKFSYSFYDQRFTDVMEGKEDLLGDTDTSNIPWYNDSGKETQLVKEKIYSLLKVVKDSNVNVSQTKNLGGALGVSKGGNIEVLENAKMNPNYFMTLTHEFAHELLHQTYLRDSSNDKEWGQFYVGRGQGRGFVEQQAELTAWIVCKFYGYDIKEAINYAAIWGMDAKNAVHAFDSVAKVSDFIINKINAKIQEEKNTNMQESKQHLNEVNFNGLDIAKMVGAEQVYLQGIKEFEQEDTNNMKMQESFKNQFNNLAQRINEIQNNKWNKIID